MLLQKTDFTYPVNAGGHGGFGGEVGGLGDSDQAHTPLNRFCSSKSVFECPGVQSSSQSPVYSVFSDFISWFSMCSVHLRG